MNKKFFYFLMWMFASILAFDLRANEQIETRNETIFNMIAKLFHDDRMSTALLVMIDGSGWEIVSPPMVKRTPDSEEPLYSFRLEDWERPIPVAIDLIQWRPLSDLDIEDSLDHFMGAHEEMMIKFPYVLENRETGKYTFARPAKKKHILDFFSHYSTFQYQNGFDDAVDKSFPRICGTDVVPTP